MIRMPGPSQVSRARASSAVTARVDGGGLGGEQQVADHHDPAAERDVDPGGPGLGARTVGLPAAPASGRRGPACVRRLCGRSHSPSIVEARRR